MTMAGEYNLGTATGRIVFEYDNKGVSAAKRDIDSVGQQTTKTGKDVKAGMNTAGRAAGTIGLAAAAGLGVIIGITAKFDKAMSAVQAATHESEENMNALRDAAIDAGAKTVFSASEAANGIEELAKAGVETKDILGGALTGALDLASAGALGVAEASEIAASAMVQFGLSGKDVPHIADLLAAGAGKAQGSVTDLGFALKYAGVPANALGVSIEETTGVLAEFASTGIVGSQAGTTLRSMLLSLAAPTKRSQELMDKYGISMYDSTGKFIGLSGAADQLKNKLGPLSEEERNHALSVMFGQTAIQGAITLYNGGGKAVDEWTGKVNDSGYAADTAAARLNNLSGDVEQLKGSLETAFIKMGESSQGPLRAVTQGLTALVNGFSNLPQPIHEGVTVALLLVSTLGLLAFAAVKVVNGMAAARLALTQLGVSAATTSRILSTTKAAIGVLGLALVGLEVGLTIVDKINKKFLDTIPGVESLTGAIIELNNTGKSSELEKSFDDLGSAIDRVNHKKIQDHVAGFFNSFLPNDSRDRDLINATNKIDALDKAMANLVATGGADVARQSFDKLASSLGLTSGQTDELLKRMPGYKEALAAASNQAAVGAGATDQYGNAIGGIPPEASAAATELEGLTKAMQDQVKAALAGFDAETQYRQALKDAAAQAAKNNAGIRGSSEAALANRSALSGLAAAWNNQSDAVKNNEARQKAAQRAFIQTARDMGVPIGQARNLAKTLLEIPSQKVINTRLSGAAQALNDLNRIKTEMMSIKDKTVRLTYYVNQVNTTNKHHAMEQEGVGVTRARGGLVRGRGTSMSDSIHARLSDYEYVQRAAAVKYYGVDFMNALNNLKIPKGQIPGFASGGLVDSSAFKSLMAANASPPVVVLPVPSPGPGAAPGGTGAAGALRLVSGTLSIDKSGRAYIAGVAAETIDSTNDYQNLLGRMG
jgi:TP901 family phage tail tape measure protein